MNERNGGKEGRRRNNKKKKEKKKEKRKSKQGQRSERIEELIEIRFSVDFFHRAPLQGMKRRTLRSGSQFAFQTNPISKRTKLTRGRRNGRPIFILTTRCCR